MSDVETENLVVQISVPFHKYGTKSDNRKAKAYIRRWVRETLQDQLSYIPLYVEKDRNGAVIEDSTQKIKIKVSSSDTCVLAKKQK